MLTRQYISQKQQVARNNAFYNKAYKVAIERNFAIDGLSPQQVYELVNAKLMTEYRIENLVDGIELHVDDNQCECETYVYSTWNNRCSCGNRRISACVEGDFINGFYISTEAY
jgi:hypothetical protein